MTIDITAILDPIKDELAFADTRVGQFMIYRNDNIISLSIALFGEYSQAEIDIMSRFLDKDSVYLDIGTNIGYHLLSIAKNTGCKVMGFEPHPIHFAVASYNCKDIPVQIVNAAVGDGKTSTLKLTNFDISREGNYGETQIDTNGELEVPIVKIDDIKFDRVDVMKIDTENQELKVLKGAETTIDTFRPVILYEAIKDSDYEKAYNFLDKKKYKQYWVAVRVCPVEKEPFKTPESHPYGETGVTNILAVPVEKEQPTDLLPVVKGEFHSDTFHRLIKYVLVF